MATDGRSRTQLARGGYRRCIGEFSNVRGIGVDGLLSPDNRQSPNRRPGTYLDSSGSRALMNCAQRTGFSRLLGARKSGCNCKPPPSLERNCAVFWLPSSREVARTKEFGRFVLSRLNRPSRDLRRTFGTVIVANLLNSSRRRFDDTGPLNNPIYQTAAAWRKRQQNATAHLW